MKGNTLEPLVDGIVLLHLLFITLIEKKHVQCSPDILGPKRENIVNPKIKKQLHGASSVADRETLSLIADCSRGGGKEMKDGMKRLKQSLNSLTKKYYSLDAKICQTEVASLRQTLHKKAVCTLCLVLMLPSKDKTPSPG